MFCQWLIWIVWSCGIRVQIREVSAKNAHIKVGPCCFVSNTLWMYRAQFVNPISRNLMTPPFSGLSLCGLRFGGKTPIQLSAGNHILASQPWCFSTFGRFGTIYLKSRKIICRHLDSIMGSLFCSLRYYEHFERLTYISEHPQETINQFLTLFISLWTRPDQSRDMACEDLKFAGNWNHREYGIRLETTTIEAEYEKREIFDKFIENWE